MAVKERKMEFRKLIHERRSIRKFTDKPVDRDVLNELLAEALWAPSGMNRQVWKLVALQGESFKQLLRFSDGMAEDMEGPLTAERFNEKMRGLVKGYFRDLGGASTAVVCLSKTADAYLADHANMVSGAALFYNFLLLAHEAGLACCWMTGYALREKEFLRMLGCEGYKLVGVTPVGYPDQTPPVPPRKGDPIVWME
jgi:nitroreductase